MYALCGVQAAADWGRAPIVEQLLAVPDLDINHADADGQTASRPHRTAS